MADGWDYGDAANGPGADTTRQSINGAKAPARFAKPKPYVWRPGAEIPLREWVYGRQIQRGTLRGLIAPGATGKTILSVGEALAMVTGRPLLGVDVPGGPKRVWLWNLEDDREELERIVQAACKHWSIGPADIGDRLFLNSALDGDSLVLGGPGERGFEINEEQCRWIEAEIGGNRIDYTHIDPMVSAHKGDESDNGQIDEVAKRCALIAAETRSSMSRMARASPLARLSPRAGTRGPPATARICTGRSMWTARRSTPWRLGRGGRSRIASPATLGDALEGAVAALGADASPGLVEGVRREVTTQWSIREADKRDREEAALEFGQQQLASNGGNWSALPAAVKSRIPTKYWPALIDFAAGLRVPDVKRTTDPETYVRLSDMASTNPAAFASMNPIEYRAKLDDEDWERFVGLRSKIREGKKETLAPSMAQIRGVVKPLVDARQLSGEQLTQENDRTGKERAALAARRYNLEKVLRQDIEVWMHNNPGKRPDAQVIQQIADRRLLMVIPHGADDEDEIPQFEANGPVRVKMPAGQMARIRSIMTPILGREPTEREMVNAYMREATARE